VEVLLSEPPINTARIVHYTKMLVPLVCLRHVRSQTNAVFDELVLAYRQQFGRIVSREAQFPNLDPYTKFAAILYLEENEALRRELCNLCSDNPLSLHRLWHLHRDYSAPSSMKSAIEGHEKRIGWQIHRIYRARNNIVHAGRVPSFLGFI